jgi:hypothetical protein
MKNQYFGDKRDLLKFTLLETLARNIPNVDQLTCIWLLTPPSPNNDGNRHFREHEGATDLAVFLKRCIANGRRDVRELARYLLDRPGRYYSYGDEASHYFTSSSRTTYFKSVPDYALRRAVVFFDPDNGLEPRTTVTPSHLKYAELKSIFDRMDDISIAVVYQHLPRQRAEKFWPSTTDKVRSALNCSAGFVASGDVGFVIALRDSTAKGQVSEVLDEFDKAWPTALRIAAPN